MVTMILTPPSPHIPLSLKPNYVELILPTCSLRTLLMVSGLLIGFLRCWKLLKGIAKLQDMSDPWLFDTPITTSPSILSGSLIHDSLAINPPEPLTDALLGFHQQLDWCTKGQADEEKTKVNKIKTVSERLTNSVWSPLENLPLFLPSSYRSLLALILIICILLSPSLQWNLLKSTELILLSMNPKLLGKCLAQN